MKAVSVKLDPLSVLHLLPAIPCVITAAGDHSLVFMYGEDDLVSRCQETIIVATGGAIVDAEPVNPRWAITTLGIKPSQSINLGDARFIETVTATPENTGWVLNPVAAYVAAGLHPLPLNPNSKIPKKAGWQKNDQSALIGPGDNVGCALGEDYVDVDLDWPRAATFATILMPASKNFGRAGKQNSHLLYKVSGLKYKAFAAPKPIADRVGLTEHKATVLELRTGRDKQTMFPPSAHDSGEVVYFDIPMPIRAIDAAELKRLAGIVAFVTVIDELWGGDSRHDQWHALCSMLWKAKVPRDQAQAIQIAIFARHGDDPKDVRRGDRNRVTKDIYDENYEKVGGWKKIGRVFGIADAEVEVLKKWLAPDKVAREDEQSTSIEKHVDEMCAKYKLVTHKGSAAFWRKGFNLELGVEEWVELSEADLQRECHKSPAVGRYLRKLDKPSYPNGFYFDPTTTEWRGGGINLWTDWAIKGEEKPWPTIERHIREVLADGNEEHYQYILRWTAYFVQHPDVMPEVALVFQGGKGVGKGFYGRALCSLAPNHSIQVSHASQVTGRFNDHMYQTIMFFADEAFWAGDKSGEGQLKRQVTDDTLTIEGKNKKIFKARNMLHMIIVSNEDWVVPATPGERRWAVFKVSDRLKGDHAFFATLAKAYAGEEMQGFFHELKTMPLGDWHPRGAVPETNALQEQKARSEALAPEAALRRWFERGVLPGTNSAFGAANVLLLPWGLRDATGIRVNKTNLPLAIKKFASPYRHSVNLGKDEHGNMRRRQVMAYSFPPLQEARLAFDPKYAWDQSETNWVHEYDDVNGTELPPDDDVPF